MGAADTMKLCGGTGALDSIQNIEHLAFDVVNH
jgi:hypothetical protein